jgi:hypothetical protein
MSDYLNALVQSEKFYILPVCNLPINPTSPVQGTDISEELWTDWVPSGYSVSTTGGGNYTQYNNNMDTIIIPDYIKNMGIDYISFSSNPTGDTTAGGQRISSIVINIKYNIDNGLNPFITGDGSSVNFVEETKYICQMKIEIGALLRIDLKNVYSINDIIITETDFIPAPTESPDKNNKCHPYSITLWKKFLTSSPTNKDTFIKNNSLSASCNEYYNPYYAP